jgi:SnoaL-like domain
MPPKLARTDQAHRYNSSMQAVAKMMPRHHRVRLDNAFVEAFGTLGYRIGIEHVFTGKRHRPVPCLDYAALAAPDRMIELQSRSLNGPEDRLFATVHQIAECWLNIVHLLVELALESGKQGDWQRAAIQTRRASSAVALATQVCRLLDAMVLSDYHCLRVQLRDGSGAQSMKARALSTAGRGLYDVLNRAIIAEGTTLMGVLDEPGKYLHLHDQQAALQDFGRRCQAFLFEHYLLALSILGADNLGSLGFPVFMLAKRAAQPFLPEVNQVKHDYTIITNFRYARRAGAIILKNELRSNPGAYADLPELKSGICPPDVIRRVSHDYFTCIENHDAEGWMSLFHPEAWLLDAPESRPFKGTDRLRIFVDSMFDRLADMHVTSLDISVGKNSSEIDWSFTAVALGIPVSFSGRESLSFTYDGRIAQAIIHWNQAELSEQIWQGKTASCTAAMSP